MTTSNEYLGNEILVKRCSKKMIKKIMQMRRKGLPYKTIAYEMGYHVTTIRKWDRTVEKYGVEVFAED